MKATGIIRRLDDLGRIVIPKEIRRSLGLSENSPLEIYISSDGKGLVLVPYEQDDIMESVHSLKAHIQNHSYWYNYSDRKILEALHIIENELKKNGF